MKKNHQQFYECPECNLKYQDEEWAEKCEAWCKKHKSCNLDIIKHAKKMKNTPKWILYSLIAVSFVGFLDSLYLTTKHYLVETLNCSLIQGCEHVTTSQYSTFLNIPVALLGVLYYLFIFILVSYCLDKKKKKILRVLLPLTSIGLIASGWFVYVQLFILKSVCTYCMLSALISTILFILSIFIVKYNKVEKIITNTHYE